MNKETRQKMADDAQMINAPEEFLELMRGKSNCKVPHHDLNPLQPTPAQIKYAKDLGISEEQLQDMFNEAVATVAPGHEAGSEPEYLEYLEKLAAAVSEHKEPTFTELAKPLIKYLNDNHHAHCSILITATSAEILEGMQAISTSEFLRG